MPRGEAFEVALCDPEESEGDEEAYRHGRPAHAREAELLWQEIERRERGFRQEFRTRFRRHCRCGADIYEVRRR